MTRSWYVGRYGTSIRLDGLDPTNPTRCRTPRHASAECATPEHVDRWRLGHERLFRHGAEQFDRALIDLSGAAGLGAMASPKTAAP